MANLPELQLQEINGNIVVQRTDGVHINMMNNGFRTIQRMDEGILPDKNEDERLLKKTCILHLVPTISTKSFSRRCTLYDESSFPSL